MNWEQRIIELRSPNGLENCQFRYTVDGESIIEVDASGSVIADARADDMFTALAEVRAVLEAKGLLVVCQGARLNVYPSPALMQATRGRRAYVLELPRSSQRPKTVDIFDSVAVDDEIATVADQRAWFDAWVNAPLSG